MSEKINPFTDAKIPYLIYEFDRMARSAAATSMMIRMGQYDAAVEHIRELSAAGKEAIRIAREKE